VIFSRAARASRDERSNAKASVGLTVGFPMPSVYVARIARADCGALSLTS
jgi:hypothetical protein